MSEIDLRPIGFVRKVNKYPLEWVLTLADDPEGEGIFPTSRVRELLRIRTDQIASELKFGIAVSEMFDNPELAEAFSVMLKNLRNLEPLPITDPAAMAELIKEIAG